MATQLLKAVHRELLARVTHGKHSKRGIIASLLPGDTLQFRYKGTRQTFECSLHSALKLAQLLTWDKQFQHKLKRYKEKKALGYRVKRPKPIRPPFAKFIYEATKNS